MKGAALECGEALLRSEKYASCTFFALCHTPEWYQHRLQRLGSGLGEVSQFSCLP